MSSFEKLNKANGFDLKNPVNAKQNSYAWSMAEFGDYIYVGTGRNVAQTSTKILSPQAVAPMLISTQPVDNNAEIWRYKKDGSLGWQRVFKAKDEDQINGLRFMVVHAAPNSTPALYAATLSLRGKASILKSTDGSNWRKVGGETEGNSSRAMVSFNGKLYVAFLSQSIGVSRPILYRSTDPEFFDFEQVFNPDDPDIDPKKNPTGGFDNMAVFNNRLYLCVSTEEGLEVWRSNSAYPKKNDWTLVVDKGFGDGLNASGGAVGVYKNHLYVTAVKKFPLIMIIPMAADMIRIDKFDKWELVVGGKPIMPTKPKTGVRRNAISGYGSGFFNPFNLYIWQVRQLGEKLVATTFDNGTNIENLRNIALLNKQIIVDEYDEDVYELLIKVADAVLYLFKKFNYPKGFDMFVSDDGVKFEPVNLTGITNSNNYGGRTLLTSSEGDLYIGTANPFDGCEILRTDERSLDKLMEDIDSRKYTDGMQFLGKKIEMMTSQLMNLIRRKGLIEGK